MRSGCDSRHTQGNDSIAKIRDDSGTCTNDDMVTDRTALPHTTPDTDECLHPDFHSSCNVGSRSDVCVVTH